MRIGDPTSGAFNIVTKENVSQITICDSMSHLEKIIGMLSQSLLSIDAHSVQVLSQKNNVPFSG